MESNTDFFTPEDLANEILDKMPKEIWEQGKTFLDPTCGSGNLLIAVAKRKLSLGHNPTDILDSLFGMEIEEHYMEECRQGLLDVCGDTKENRRIVEDHIITGDFLNTKHFSQSKMAINLFFKGII